MLDWEANVDTHFVASHFMRPKPVRPVGEMDGYVEKWICYRSTYFSAKELTMLPGQRVTAKDAAAYGLIAVQGHGTLGSWQIESPSLIRYGQQTSDEFYVSEAAALEGVRINNPSATDPLVLLKHFGPENPELVVTP